MTTDKQRRLEELRREEKKLAAEIDAQQRQCRHDWGETVYDPEHEPDYVFSHYKGRGSDPEPVFNRVGDKEIPRWSRTCKKCGKVQYTKVQRTVKTEPDFR